jgi:hypothetical protein
VGSEGGVQVIGHLLRLGSGDGTSNGVGDGHALGVPDEA